MNGFWRGDCKSETRVDDEYSDYPWRNCEAANIYEWRNCEAGNEEKGENIMSHSHIHREHILTVAPVPVVALPGEPKPKPILEEADAAKPVGSHLYHIEFREPINRGIYNI